jgi:hypothetical protein
MRLEAMLEKSSEMSSVEIAFLASIYEHHANLLRQRSQTMTPQGRDEKETDA